MYKYLNNSDKININLICDPTTNLINKDIIATATVKRAQSLIPGATVYFKLIANDANTAFFKNNGQTEISALTNSFGQATAVFSDKTPGTGKISVSLDENFTTTAAETDYQFTDTNSINRYLIFRNLENPTRLSFVTTDEALTQFSEPEMIPSVSISGSGEFVAFLNDKRPAIIYIDKNDNLLKTTTYNGSTWKEPTQTIKTNTPDIATLGQVEIINDKLKIVCTRKSTYEISILTLTKIIDDDGFTFEDIKNAKSLSWASSLEREWNENSKEYYLKSYYGVVPGQKIDVYELFGQKGGQQQRLTRSTSAGANAENDGTFALKGKNSQENKRTDTLFFQCNEDFGVIISTANDNNTDKNLHLTRSNLPLSDKRIQPKEGVTAAYSNDGGILSFGLNQGNIIIIMHIEINKNNSDTYVNNYTNTNIKAFSSYIYLI